MYFHKKKIHFENYVKCFYNNKSPEPLIIYDNYNGEKIQTLTNDEKYCWYKLIIKKTRNGWAKIHRILGIPDCSNRNKIRRNNGYENSWVELDGFLIFSFFPPIGEKSVPIYDKPNIKSREIVNVNKFVYYQVIETKKLWAKVKFEFNGKVYSGWLRKEDQCANPWTAC
ncbi:hypothetical protein TAMYLO_330215 [Tenacibaculum amylolyticum]